MNKQGSSVLQAIIVIALTAMVGGGVAQMTRLAVVERKLISNRKRIDAFTDYISMLLMDPSACDQYLILGSIPANLEPFQEINNIGVRVTLPLSSPSSAIIGQSTSGLDAIRARFGVDLTALDIKYKSLGGDRGQIIINAKTTSGPAFVRVAGQINITPGNPARCTGGMAGPQLTCTLMGGILEIQTDGHNRCVIAPRDMAPCGPSEYIADISPPTQPGGDPIITCQSAVFTCPPGKYFVGIVNGSPECQPVMVIAATPVAAAPVAGVCGAAHGNSFVDQATLDAANLCNAGIASGTSGAGPWSWFCVGTNGGANANCNASKTIAAAIGCLPTGTVISDQFVAQCYSPIPGPCNLNLAPQTLGPLTTYHPASSCCMPNSTTTGDVDDCTDMGENGGAHLGYLCWRMRNTVCN